MNAMALGDGLFAGYCLGVYAFPLMITPANAVSDVISVRERSAAPRADAHRRLLRSVCRAIKEAQSSNVDLSSLLYAAISTSRGTSI